MPEIDVIKAIIQPIALEYGLKRIYLLVHLQRVQQMKIVILIY